MAEIDIVRLALVVTHLIGLAAVIGPVLTQWRARSDLRLRWMLAGAIAQVVTGNLLILMRRFGDLEVDEVKMLVKLVIALLVLVGVIVAMVVQRAARRRGATALSARAWMLAAGGLAIAAVVVAVFWG